MKILKNRTEPKKALLDLRVLFPSETLIKDQGEIEFL